jgi:hypothetical protein
VEKAISDFTALTQTRNNDGKTSQVTLADLGADIKQHIDRRMIEFIERQPADSSRQSGQPRENDGLSYAVPILINFSDLQSQQYLEIDSRTTVQDVLDNVYFMIEQKVKPFHYLQTWIIRETRLGINLVIREVAGVIPARFIFTPATEWEVVKLPKPYKPSADNDRWYGVTWR